MQEWIFAAIIVFFASALQAITGFGFAIAATPFLLLLYNSRDSIQISIFLSFFIAILLIPRIRHKIDYPLFRRLAAGSLLGVPLGLWFYAFISLDSLKIIISVVILAVTFFSLLSQYKNRAKQKHPADRKAPNPGGELLAGFCSGILTSSIGMPGVPLALYFTANNTDKEVVRSTTLAFFGVVYVASILAQTVTLQVEVNALYSALILAPVTAIGVVAGHLIFPKVRQSLFLVITNIILIYTAIYMLTRV